MATTRDRDLGWKRIRRAIKEAEGASVAVGWFPDAQHGELQTAELAAIHEYGGGTVPARPMIRPVVDRGREEYRALARRAWGALLRGEVSVAGALQAIGARVATDLKKWITSGDHLPLAKSTIDRKGSSRPLIDTGAMRDQVEARVRRR